MNEQTDPWGSPQFQDKLLWDTRLSPTGVMKIKSINETLRSSPQSLSETSVFFNTELIVSSPLTRSLQTAELFCDSIHDSTIQKLVHPLLTERVYTSSEHGREKETLQLEFPNWDFTHVPESPWWWIRTDPTPYIEWRPQGQYAVEGEPLEDFLSRMSMLRHWLLSLPHERITVFTHWGVIHSLTGESFQNGQMKSFKPEELLETPIPH